MTTTTETGPRVCYWVQEPDGTRWLVPGCIARLHDPHADPCTCPTLAGQLAQAREELGRVQRHYSGLREWTDAVIAAVNAHRDGTAIMKAAADRATTTNPQTATRT